MPERSPSATLRSRLRGISSLVATCSLGCVLGCGGTSTAGGNSACVGSACAQSRSQADSARPTIAARRGGEALRLNASVEGDQFGQAVAIDGDLLALGAPGRDPSGTGSRRESGAVYVYERRSAGWEQVAELVAPDASAGDLFGSALALDGDLLAVGAPSKPAEPSRTGGRRARDLDGATYLFVRGPDGAWSHEATLRAQGDGAGVDGGANLGAAVALSGTLVAVGAPDLASGDAADGIEGPGAVLVYRRETSRGSRRPRWIPEARVTAPHADPDDHFGMSVALDGSTLVVGAFLEDGGANAEGSGNPLDAAGAAYAFERVERNGKASWQPRAYLKAPDPVAGDLFGAAVAIDGDDLVVGAPARGTPHGELPADAGAAFVFERASDGGWAHRTTLTAPNAGEGDGFGHAVAIAEDRIVIGAWGEASAATDATGTPWDDSATFAGAAYVYRREAERWAPPTYLKSTPAEATDLFGGAVAIDDDRVLVGAPEEAGADNATPLSGAAFVFDGL